MPPPLDLPALNARFAAAHPADILRWAADTFPAAGPAPHPLIMTSSFGAESMALIHLAIQAVPRIPIVFINTGYLFPETLTFMEQMCQRFALNVLEYHSPHNPLTWLTVHGEPDPNVRQNPDACCAANKNAPFDAAMKALAPAAWIRGIRADQTQTRQQMSILQWSPRFHTLAISPLLHWSARDIFQYMKLHDLPFHPLWEKGYTSIGCHPATCTRAAGAAEDPRAGRWAGSAKKECGLHLEPPPTPSA